MREIFRRALLFTGILASIIVTVHVLESMRPFSYAQVPKDIRAEQERWAERIDAVGGEAAYEELVYAVKELTPTQQHVPAHIFGGALYVAKGLDGLSVCDNRLLYGCFHEFLSRAIVEKGLSIVPELERRCPLSPYSDAPISCQHGLGHGLLAYFGYERDNLRSAIAQCDMLLNDAWHACAQGAFMEYHLRFFVAADGIEARKVESNNIYDPCEEYEGINAQRCVGLLPVWWRVVLFPDPANEEAFAWAGEQCRNLPPALREYRTACFRGIGFIAVTTFTPELDTVERLCTVASRSYAPDQQECMIYATVTINTEGDGRGTPLCKRLPIEAQPMCEHYATSVPLI